MRDRALILVVDDDPAILELAQELLSTSYLVETAQNGKEAQERLLERSYDLVLTDMVMPEMGGLELVQHIRLNHPETPVMVFTGYASYQDAVAAVKLGACDYLTKPVQPDILFHAVGRALEFQRLTRAQRDLEVIFQGAEALGGQVLELIAGSPEAAVLASLKEQARQVELPEAGRRFLSTAQELLQATCSSIFLYDSTANRFHALAARGLGAESRTGAEMAADEGIMGYLLTHTHPLLVPDLEQDLRFSLQPRRPAYRTPSFMIIPLSGYKFWGVINLADREDGCPFTSRELFLGWLLGRLLVEVLESREAPRVLEDFALPLGWLQDQVSLGLAILGQNLKVLQANQALESLVHPGGGSLVGRELLPRLGFSAPDEGKLTETLQEVLSGREPRQLPPLKSAPAADTVRFLRAKMAPLPPEQGAPRALLLMEDVTELEQLRQRLYLYEHLAIMGKLTLCVAHEMNNPLDGIRRYLSLAQIKKDQPQEVERYLMEAQKGLQKMSMTIKSLMSSANPLKAPRPSDSVLNLLQDAVKIMMFQASDQKVQVSFHPAAELREVMAEGDLYHVFINLIKNALQAMPQGGSLDINGSLNPQEVAISFEDTGPGIPSQELNRIFQPFFSTKEDAQGLGLGLPICRKILERYGGRLEVESQPGQGTKVSVILPQSSPGGRCGAQRHPHRG